MKREMTGREIEIVAPVREGPMDYADLDDGTLYRAVTAGTPQAMVEMVRRYWPGLHELAVAAGMSICLGNDEMLLRSYLKVIASVPAPNPGCFWVDLGKAVEEVRRERGSELGDLE